MQPSIYHNNKYSCCNKEIKKVAVLCWEVYNYAQCLAKWKHGHFFFCWVSIGMTARSASDTVSSYRAENVFHFTGVCIELKMCLKLSSMLQDNLGSCLQFAWQNFHRKYWKHFALCSVGMSTVLKVYTHF